MNAEFQTAKGWRWFIYIFSTPLIGLFVIVGYIALTSETSKLTVILILIPVSIGGTMMMTYGLIETIKGRFIIGNNSVSRKGIFGTRTLAFEDIKGFSIGDNYIHIVSANKKKKSIKITAYIEKSDQVIDWLSDHFTNLGSYEALEEEAAILGSDEFGINAQARELRLNEARRAAKYINIMGSATGVWLFFYPYPYMISLMAGVGLPIIAFASLYFYRGLIRFDEKKNSAYPSIAYGFLLPAGGLCLRAIMDFEILAYTNLWVAISIFTVVLTAMFVLATNELKFKKFIDYFTCLSLAAIILAYSFGAYVVLNCLFDRSEPEIFTRKVLSKEVSSGKSTSYYLTLEPWGPRTEAEDVTVTKAEYESTHPGETVDIYLRQGSLNTPWFYIVTD